MSLTSVLLCVDIQFPRSFVEESVFSSACTCAAFVENQVLRLRGLISGPSVLSHLSRYANSLLAFFYYDSMVQYEIRHYDSSSINLLLRIVLAFLGL